MNPTRRILAVVFVLILIGVPPVWALDLDFKGSLADGKHKRYVPPVSNPVVNETPYITTELRPMYLHTDLPGNVPLPGAGGGVINLWAVQLRVALTERLGFIANKDGWADVNFTQLPGLDDDGFANISLGFKYALISDPRTETIVTGGLIYEAPTGRLKAGPFWLQGNGDGFITPFLSGAKSFDKLGLQGYLGGKFALDGDKNTSWLNYSLHMDYEVIENLFPLVELNGFTPIADANQTPFEFGGLDLVSIGASDPGSVVTFATGARYKITDHILVGAAYEVPITKRKDILKWRLTADVVFYY